MLTIAAWTTNLSGGGGWGNDGVGGMRVTWRGKKHKPEESSPHPPCRRLRDAAGHPATKGWTNKITGASARLPACLPAFLPACIACTAGACLLPAARTPSH